MLAGRHLLATLVAVVLGAGVAAAVTAQSAQADQPLQTVQRSVPAAPVQQPSRTAACTRPAPTTAAGYQAMFDAKRDSTWAGGDQGASVRLPNGRELWLFGDTLRDGRLVHNSLLVQRGGCLTAVPAVAEVIPSRADGQWYWPQSATVVGTQLLVFCGRVERTGSDAFGFRTTGTEVAVFDLVGGLPRFSRMAPTPSSDSHEEQFQYGAATVLDGDLLYVWGSRKVPGAFGREVSVARVRFGAWQFWTGHAWSPRAADARPVADGWSTGFSVWRAGGSLHALTKQDDVYGHAVVTGTAAAPTAAFTQRQVLSAPSSDLLLYNALAHPEIPLANGELLVTVCRNSPDLHRVLSTPGLYVPQFHSVPA